MMSSAKTGPLPQAVGPYIITEKIGSGGMATVYRAYHAEDQREVAVKVLAVHLTGDENARKRFEREAETLLRLNHAHILPVYDFGDDKGIPYLVMKLLTGRSVRDLLTGTPLPFDQIGLITRQIGSALDYAHARGIIHRDIKPSNILFDHDGTPYLGDFGVASVASTGARLTSAGEFVGTVSYASPEQCRGDDAGSSSDIYSLGVVVFQMATGQLPFQGPSSIAVIKKHMNEELPNPIALNPRLPLGIYAVLTRALAKLPENRYASAMQFSEALDEILGLLPTDGSHDEAWLYDQPEQIVSDPAPGRAGSRPFEDIDDAAAPPDANFPFEDVDLFTDVDEVVDLFIDEDLDPFAAQDFPRVADVLTTEPSFDGEPLRPAIRPLGARPLGARPPVATAGWQRVALYGSMVISLLALVLSGIILYTRLRDPGIQLDATFRSPELGIAFDAPSGWFATGTDSPIVAGAVSPWLSMSDQPTSPLGPYVGSVAIGMEWVDPVIIYGVPPSCQSEIPHGPVPTFVCMKERNFMVPVHKRFDTDHFRGARLPGTLPPTNATLPIILLADGGQHWLTVVLVYWNGHEHTIELLEKVAESVRPTG